MNECEENGKKEFILWECAICRRQPDENASEEDVDEEDEEEEDDDHDNTNSDSTDYDVDGDDDEDEDDDGEYDSEVGETVTGDAIRQEQDVIKERYRAICDFEGQQDGDLTFKTGDLLTIHEKR